ncbi:MAG: hypothetical protein HYT39_01150 [Candidatus Sungbacteria bacterium]|nr:hypothetical protein [Candidatus Sungbacteria bacterium]
MPLSQKEILEKYAKLPENVKRAMFSVVTADRIFDIGKKHGLQIDKIGVLTQEIAWVMLGEKRAREFVDNLAKTIGLPHQKAYEIAQDVNHQIFFEIRENLKKLHDIPQADALIPETFAGGPLPGKPEETPPPAGPPRDANYWRNLNLTKAAPAPQPPTPKTSGELPALGENLKKEVNEILGVKKSAIETPLSKPEPPAGEPRPAGGSPREIKREIKSGTTPVAPAVTPAPPPVAPRVKELPKPPTPVPTSQTPPVPAPAPTATQPPLSPSPATQPKPEIPKSYGGGDPYREPID